MKPICALLIVLTAGCDGTGASDAPADACASCMQVPQQPDGGVPDAAPAPVPAPDAGLPAPVEVAQRAYVKASNTGAQDSFGWSLALSGDIMAVGAPLESSSVLNRDGAPGDDSLASSGAVYVFRHTEDGWAQEAFLKASNADVGDSFGWSLALSGDTLVVGAPLESSAATGVDRSPSDNSAPEAGAAYVFRRTQGGWVQEAYLKASNTDAGDRFGWKVAADGDTVVVGAVREDGSARRVDGDDDDRAPDSGAAYVFRRAAGGWAQEGYLKAGNTTTETYLGSSVAIHGDVIAVGAEGEDTGLPGDGVEIRDSGAAYVFRRSDGIWAEEAFLKASNPGADDWFGIRVAVNGDTLAVGARREDSGATGAGGEQDDDSRQDSGAVYVFRRGEAQWAQEAYLKAPFAEREIFFGSGLSLAPDLLVVGAYGESNSATGINQDFRHGTAFASGAAYVYHRDGAGWAPAVYIKASNTDPFDIFGWRVVLDRDVLAISANREASSATGIGGDQLDNSAHKAGAVYLFDITDHTGPTALAGR